MNEFALLPLLFARARDTFRDPRAVARWLMGLRIPTAERWLILALIAVVSGALAHVSMAIVAGPFAVPAPIAMALAQGVTLWVMVVAIHGLGRWAGGHGTLDDTIVLVAWVQVILLGLQVVQIVLALVAPMLAMLLGLAGIVVLFWLLTVFTAELHGFAAPGAVFFSLFLGSLVLATLERFVFGLFGLSMLGAI